LTGLDQFAHVLLLEYKALQAAANAWYAPFLAS
jgi:hypothetical protein